MRVWRICKERFLDSAFEGIGAKKVGGRWNSPGTAVVYASESLALAALELLVHLNVHDEPPDLVAIWADVDEAALAPAVAVDELPADWQRVSGHRRLQTRGDKWVATGRSVALAVPSVVIAEERNIILNPGHPGFEKAVEIGQGRPFSFDRRLYA